MVEHIDKTRLDTDLCYRFNFLSKFIDFNQNDINILNQLSSIIFPKLPSIIDLIYKKLNSFDVTKRYFSLHNDGFQQYSPSNTKTLDTIQTEFRKDMLTVYLKRVLTQKEWNETFIQYLSRVGQIHTNKDGSSSINVDYIYMNGLFSCLEQLLIDIISNEENLDQKLKYLGIKAVSKFIWIQNDLLTMHYEKKCGNIPIVKLSKCFFI